ncbi:MAG: bifunctional N-acetylglucosamine-1-phosphate uridyltransferase/glucosamine-1-phosphate acetyltransferase [Candidatus Omnitrophota bacterium]
MAAGKGTRMKSDLPKVLHPVCGRPMLNYVLDAVKAAGSLKQYVVVGHQADHVTRILPDTSQAVEQKKLLGTADAVKTALKQLPSNSGDILITCGDTPLLTAKTLKALVKSHRQTGASCTILTSVVEDSTGYGRVVRGIDGDPVVIREERDANPDERRILEINTGVYCFKASSLRKAIADVKMNVRKKEYYLTDVVEIMAARRWKIAAYETEDPSEGWGVNDKIALARCGEVIRYRILEDLMRSGVSIVDPCTTFISADVRIGANTVIKPFTVIEDDVRIGKECQIGPFAHVRPGVRIGDRTEIGNFTEISRSSVGKDCFMKHFSFLGDARVGSRVNIGAGAVTANFDGKDKHQTRVGDDAFVGSDAILVAPARVGKKSVVGAGCVMAGKKDVPAGKVMVGVPGRVLDKKKTQDT